MKVLQAIAGNDTVKVAIVKSGGAHMILDAMTKHVKNASICEAGCAALTTIVLRNPDHCKVVMEAQGAEILTKVLTLHPDKKMLQVRNYSHTVKIITCHGIVSESDWMETVV